MSRNHVKIENAPKSSAMLQTRKEETLREIGDLAFSSVQLYAEKLKALDYTACLSLIFEVLNTFDCDLTFCVPSSMEYGSTCSSHP